MRQHFLPQSNIYAHLRLRVLDELLGYPDPALALSTLDIADRVALLWRGKRVIDYDLGVDLRQNNLLLLLSLLPIFSGFRGR